MRLPKQHQQDPLEVKMTPMIDVVFLLLVFFVWTSSFELPEYDLPGAMAETPATGSVANEPSTPPAEAFDEIVVKILVRDGLPVIEMGGQRVGSTDELRSKLAEVIQLGVQPPVIIDPEQDVAMRRAIEVYDVARDAGADRVLYAIEPPDSALQR
ncbi:biopolymer transporter ExbD [Roseiconus nitratireducens]|uniref:Biopolymer transporter ExbD n=1 Tax=Roseiconus nitratireducens TaxID=2605748 RepID=A0A5M6DCM3_9BACT|nr:biopolymer transporter ExbD [Roseiconus nitratireducens]KAA5545307.1 biopolymer transporter ExbD [Roseiconus nitratireducens]